MKHLTLESFTQELSAKMPVPGGGGAAALAGDLAAALSSMVVNYTLGKKRYLIHNDRLEDLIEKSEKLRNELLDLTEKDAKAFRPLSKAYSLPEETPEQKKRKETIMENALEEAARVPLEIAKSSCEIILIHKELAEIGSKMVLSDIGVGVSLAA